MCLYYKYSMFYWYCVLNIHRIQMYHYKKFIMQSPFMEPRLNYFLYLNRCRQWLTMFFFRPDDRRYWRMWGLLYEFVLLLLEFQLVYKRLGPDSSSVMTGFVLVSFSGRVLVVQEVLRTVIIAPYRKAILVYVGFVDV